MRAGVPTNSKTRPGDQRELGGAAVWTRIVFASTPASGGVQHVIGDLVVRQARGGFEVATLWQFVRGERRTRNVFGHSTRRTQASTDR